MIKLFVANISTLSGSERRSDRGRPFLEGHLAYWLGGLVLCAIYTNSYFRNAAVPSPKARFPEGWWGWFDQSKYLQSAQALAHLDFHAALHWYPFGYALLGAPFAWMGYHAYFLPDLICLLLTGGGFLAVAQALGARPLIGVLLFLLATVGTQDVRNTWVEPWNTTLACALIWWSFALACRLVLLPPETQLAKHRLAGFTLWGALLAFIPVVRPTDALIAGGVVAFSFLTALATRSLRLKELACAILGAAIVLSLCGALWLRIYGAHPSDYMVMSKGLGFRLDLLWWKTYLLLITPRPWFPDGSGLLQHIHWLYFSLVGMALLPFLGLRRAFLPLILLAGLSVFYALLFFSYVDLIPSGLWRYNNVHYFKWMFPACALLGWWALHQFFSRQWRLVLAIGAAIFILSGIRLLPVPASTAQTPIWMVTLHEPSPSWPDLYFSDLTLRDNRAIQHNIHDFRAMPDSQGERWITLAHPFNGVPTPYPASSKSVPEQFWRMHLTWRPDPCWLPPHPCNFKPPLP